jgi:acetylxylan esterase
MRRNRTSVGVLLVAALLLLAAMPAQAASPTQVTADWKGGVSLPSDVTMWVYQPTNVATNPPILTLIHYCGGTASNVFGQATTVINVVNQNGAIVVLPSSGRCWDVQTTKGLTRDGGGDSHAIAQMVRYAITTYKANADRVYSTGDSSGGMMTQLLLALYPDIFKAGASFAGIPAGCRSGNETGNGYSSACAGGSITKTAQQWGDIVRAMDPGYSGHRPRVQLFHGDSDTTINYKCFGEAVKEWSNVLGLDPTTPTSTSTVTLGSHQATRQSWKNSCGYVVLDAFTSIGGDHGPSDALFNSYVAPFLGLDKTGATDPEIAQCGAGGAGGSSGAGGNTGAGGASGAGGSSGARDGGPDGRDASNPGAGGGGGIATTGGSVGSGGSTGTGGSIGRGGSSGTGGNAGASGSGRGGAPGGGGSSANGGNSGSGTAGSGGASGSGSGGAPGSGGSAANGGSGGSGGNAGASGSGGSAAKGGSAGNGSGGMSSTGGNSGTGGSTPGGGTGSNGCGCVLGGATSKNHAYVDIALGLALLAFARRRPTRASRRKTQGSRGGPEGSSSRKNPLRKDQAL